MKNQDFIVINNLQVETFVGINAHEQIERQPVIINIKMAVNNAAALSNDINDAINYKVVYDKVTNFVIYGKFLLLENMAEQIANLLFENFSIQYVKIEINKPNALNKAIAGTIVERVRQING